MTKIVFTEKTFPHQVQQVDEYGSVTRANEIEGSIVPLAKNYINNIADENLDGFKAIRFKSFVERAIKLSFPKEIRIIKD